MDQHKDEPVGQSDPQRNEASPSKVVRPRPAPALKAELDRWLESKDLQPPK